MKKTIINIAFMLLCTVISTGCTMHDGNIGEWFGSWHLEEMLIDGEIDREYADNRANDQKQVMVSFQGTIFQMAYIESSELYGSWSYSGEVLTLIAGKGYESPYFNPYPIVLHFPADVEQVEITVTHISGKTMQWQLIDQNGDLITYNWRKYP